MYNCRAKLRVAESPVEALGSTSSRCNSSGFSKSRLGRGVIILSCQSRWMFSRVLSLPIGLGPTTEMSSKFDCRNVGATEIDVCSEVILELHVTGVCGEAHHPAALPVRCTFTTRIALTTKPSTQPPTLRPCPQATTAQYPQHTPPPTSYPSSHWEETDSHTSQANAYCKTYCTAPSTPTHAFSTAKTPPSRAKMLSSKPSK